MITVACPTCRQVLQTPPEAAGQVVSCPHCRYPLQVAAGVAPPQPAELGFDESVGPPEVGAREVARRKEARKAKRNAPWMLFCGVVMILFGCGFLAMSFRQILATIAGPQQISPADLIKLGTDGPALVTVKFDEVTESGVVIHPKTRRQRMSGVWKFQFGRAGSDLVPIATDGDTQLKETITGYVVALQADESDLERLRASATGKKCRLSAFEIQDSGRFQKSFLGMGVAAACFLLFGLLCGGIGLYDLTAKAG